jgi:hypothetical protein
MSMNRLKCPGPASGFLMVRKLGANHAVDRRVVESILGMTGHGPVDEVAESFLSD